MSSSIHRVLAVEDSERVKKSCLTLLQTSLIFFYPDKPDLIDKVNELARFLGGDLEPPKAGMEVFSDPEGIRVGTCNEG